MSLYRALDAIQTTSLSSSKNYIKIFLIQKAEATHTFVTQIRGGKKPKISRLIVPKENPYIRGEEKTLWQNGDDLETSLGRVSGR